MAMRLLVDEDVRDDIAGFLRGRGHEILLARELVASEEDPVVAKLAHEREAVIVTFNHRDFRNLIARRPRDADKPASWVQNQQRFPRAGRISFNRCLQVRALRRLRQVIELIEYEHKRLQAKRGDRRLIVEIEEECLRIY
jgi:hypothetical protein